MTDQFVELDQFLEVIHTSINPDEEENMKISMPLMSFAGDCSKIRAYIYATIASPQNTNQILEPYFVAACNRFAVDGPTPSVATKC